MVEELPEEELEPDSGEGSSEERSQSDDAHHDEQPGDQHQRLSEPDSPEEAPPFIDPEQPNAEPVVPHRHPTGTPGLTGGWMAESSAEQELGGAPASGAGQKSEAEEDLATPSERCRVGDRSGSGDRPTHSSAFKRRRHA